MAGAAAAALVIGTLLGWTLAPSGGMATAAPPGGGVAALGDTDASPQGALRSVDGVLSGWPRTRQGAIGAAASYAMTLSERWFLTDSDRRHQAVVRMAAPEATAQLQASQDQVAAAMARGAFGAALTRPGVTSLLRTSLLGYRVDRYTLDTAEIGLWAMVLYGNDADGLLPQTLYATSTLKLRWADDWKLVAATTIPGPVPTPGQGMPTPAADLIRVADSFKEFDYAPAQ